VTIDIQVLPYAAIIEQQVLKHALEMCYVEPRISGVLISGERGTGKSTTVRAFSQMVAQRLPITLPINATEDRVIGGWDIGALMQSKDRWKQGLLEEANEGLLFIDEVNLLDDHIVNIILDVTATGILVVAREGQREEMRIRFTLVGTMNPEEGTLRPQLLDRFGLMVSVKAEPDLTIRGRILESVLRADDAPERAEERARDTEKREVLVAARDAVAKLDVPAELLNKCVKLSTAFEADGHRGDYTLALAARAYAAVKGDACVTEEHVGYVAPLALQHRRKVAGQRELVPWSEGDQARVAEVLGSE
jgi:magnesium chelatase subunit I